MIKIFHSDRGGDKELHKIILSAYKILSDPVKKLIFDNYGNVGLHLLSEKSNTKLKIIESILSDPNLTLEDRKTAKNYLMFKIDKQLKNFEMVQKSTNKEANTIINSELNYTSQTAAFDYLISKYIYQKEKIMLASIGSSKRIALEEQILLYTSKDQSHEVYLNVSLSVNPEKLITSEDFSIDVNKKISIPYTIFGQTFIDSSASIMFSDEGISLSQYIGIGNFCNVNNLTFSVQPTINISKRVLQDKSIGLSWQNTNRSIYTSLKYLIFTKTIKSQSMYRFSDSERINFILNLSPSSYMVGGVYSVNNQKDKSNSFSVFLRNSMVILSSEFFYHLKFFDLDFKSSINLSKNEKSEVIDFSSMFTIGIKFKKFKLQFPIVISTSKSIFAFATLGLSCLVRLGVNYIYDKWKYYNNQHKFLFDKINANKHQDFNARFRENYLSKLEKEKSVNGLEILHAFIGEFEVIEEICRIIDIFGNYEISKNDSRKVFDVKLPLSLIIIESKLIIPKNFTEIEGVFIPDFRNSNNLGMAVVYRYQMITNSILIKNNGKKSIEIPFSVPKNGDERCDTDRIYN